MHAFAFGDLAAGVGKHVELAAAGLHFLEVALELFEQAVVGGRGDDGHALALQGFGVDVIRPLQPQARSAEAYPVPHWLGQA